MTYETPLFILLQVLVGIVMLYVLDFHIKNIQAVRAYTKSPLPNEFLVKLPFPWMVLPPIITLPLVSYRFLESMDLKFVLIIALFIALIIIRVVFNKQLFIFQKNALFHSLNNRSTAAGKVTSIRISKDEITIDTKRYKKLHRVKTESLLDKEWQEFQSAVEEFAARHEHIEVEKF